MTIPHLTISTTRMRLTLTYLGIIMALTLGFSTVIYYQSIYEAKANLVRQQQGLRDYLYFTRPDDIARISSDQLHMFRRNLLKRLTAVNIGMLLLGSGVSYVLARRSLRPLEQTLEAQSRFTSDAAHELRTPLTAMKLETELALREAHITHQEAKDILGSNLEEIAKLEALTSALLRLARSGDSVDRTNWQDYKLQDILQAAVARQADRSKSLGIRVKLPDTKAVVHGDPDQLVELFVPLIANAIKYSPKGSDVVIKVHDSDNKIKTDIIDRGAGIADADLPHIFERFYRADQSRNKSKVEGYGLGLSIADAIVSAHHGKIRVKSQVGKGSTFSVELPAAAGLS